MSRLNWLRARFGSHVEYLHCIFFHSILLRMEEIKKTCVTTMPCNTCVGNPIPSTVRFSWTVSVSNKKPYHKSQINTWKTDRSNGTATDYVLNSQQWITLSDAVWFGQSVTVRFRTDSLYEDWMRQLWCTDPKQFDPRSFHDSVNIFADWTR